MFIEQADGFSMDVAYMKVLPLKSEEIKESTKGGGPPKAARPLFVDSFISYFLGSTFKNSFENDVKRQKVRFGVSISLLGYVKSTLNVC